MPIKQTFQIKNYLHLLTRLCTAKSMQEMDRRAIQDLGIPGIVLMENAARSVADSVEHHYLREKPEATIVVCCGKGNNGGDGYAIARLLKNRGYQVTVIETGPARSEDAQLNQKLWSHFGASLSYPGKEAQSLMAEADILIDAIFGTGLEREIEGIYREWIETINQLTAIRVAVDIPSGVHSDDSRIMGIATCCDLTVSFQVGKQGCHQYPGAEYAGKIEIPDISIPKYWEPSEKSVYLLNHPFIRQLLPKRSASAHKGSFGHLLTVCGSAGMGGAATMASYAALKNGTGLVSACVPACLRDALPCQPPEIMTLVPSGKSKHFSQAQLPFVLAQLQLRDAAVVGCGVGQHAKTGPFIRELILNTEKPILLDADGLNNINAALLKKRKGPTVITPHPKELSRLCGLNTAEIQNRRIETARQYAEEWEVVLLLKGANSLVASPEGSVFINPTGNEGMATGGSGDVLSGIIGGFLAQGCDPLQAALAGVYLHGLSADCLKDKLTSPYMSAMDLIEGLNLAYQSLS
ncbi:NAD(P)H-hydrate dehydratase [Deltaproteobacteria bacterium TL4]